LVLQEDHLFELYQLAQQYRFMSLAQHCSELFLECANEENFSALIELAISACDKYFLILLRTHLLQSSQRHLLRAINPTLVFQLFFSDEDVSSSHSTQISHLPLRPTMTCGSTMVNADASISSPLLSTMDSSHAFSSVLANTSKESKKVENRRRQCNKNAIICGYEVGRWIAYTKLCKQERSLLHPFEYDIEFMRNLHMSKGFVFLSQLLLCMPLEETRKLELAIQWHLQGLLGENQELITLLLYRLHFHAMNIDRLRGILSDLRHIQSLKDPLSSCPSEVSTVSNQCFLYAPATLLEQILKEDLCRPNTERYALEMPTLLGDCPSRCSGRSKIRTILLSWLWHVVSECESQFSSQEILWFRAVHLMDRFLVRKTAYSVGKHSIQLDQLQLLAMVCLKLSIEELNSVVKFGKDICLCYTGDAYNQKEIYELLDEVRQTKRIANINTTDSFIDHVMKQFSSANAFETIIKTPSIAAITDATAAKAEEETEAIRMSGNQEDFPISIINSNTTISSNSTNSNNGGSGSGSTVVSTTSSSITSGMSGDTVFVSSNERTYSLAVSLGACALLDWSLVTQSPEMVARAALACADTLLSFEHTSQSLNRFNQLPSAQEKHLALELVRLSYLTPPHSLSNINQKNEEFQEYVLFWDTFAADIHYYNRNTNLSFLRVSFSCLL